MDNHIDEQENSRKHIGNIKIPRHVFEDLITSQLGESSRLLNISYDFDTCSIVLTVQSNKIPIKVNTGDLIPTLHSDFYVVENNKLVLNVYL